MKTAPIPQNEAARLSAVQQLQILDTKPEARFDEITQKAMDYFQVPISTVSILDEKREWFKSCQGMCGSSEGSRDISFCGHALLSEYIFIVEDALKDERFADNPYVTGPPYVRFYAGIRLMDRKNKQPVGVFCIKDTKPRTFNYTDTAAFIELGNRAEDELNRPADDEVRISKGPSA